MKDVFLGFPKLSKKRPDTESRIAGTLHFVGLLQQKYGYTREHAEEEFNRRIKGVKEAVK